MVEGDIATMEQLLARGLDPNTRIPGERLQRTPLFIAVKEDQLEAAKVLLKAGANPKIEDENGDPVMVYAADHGREAFARLLIEQSRNTDNLP